VRWWLLALALGAFTAVASWQATQHLDGRLPPLLAIGAVAAAAGGVALLAARRGRTRLAE
jgi:hypothetical protein